MNCELWSCDMNSTLGSVVPLAMFLDFPQNFRLSTWNQYCTQAIAWSTILDGGNTILDGGSTILDGSSTIFCRISQFTLFCRDLHYVAIYALFPQFFFGQNSLLRNITRFLHVCLKAWGSFLVLEAVHTEPRTNSIYALQQTQALDGKYLSGCTPY